MKSVNIFDYFYVMSTQFHGRMLLAPLGEFNDFLYEMERIATRRFHGMSCLRTQFSNYLKEGEEM